MPLYLATSNPGKVREFLNAGLDVELLPGLKEIAPPDETGTTFEENAALKAVYYSQHCDGVVLAEDSGLEVDALGGAPGVYSARYAGTGDDNDNNRHLLAKLADQQDRRGRYVAVIALAQAGEVLGTFRGTVEGEILEAPRGEGGFGYDPLFFYPPFGQTFGESTLERKASVSHRGAAIRLLSAWLASRAGSQEAS
jgi:XTP/dITP diphosphohydrolase